MDSLLEPAVTGLGFELWGVELLNHGKRSVLKVYIDHDDGIDIEDCAAVSRQVGSLLDVEEPIPGDYTLEVSSPGMDRRLFRLEQFAACQGERVRVNLRRAFEGKRRYRGILVGVEGDEVVLRTDEEEEVLFPFSEIDRASVIPEF